MNKYFYKISSSLLALNLALLSNTPQAALLDIAQAPLTTVSSGDARPNVLFVLDNSNSMDERPDGEAVGSFSPESKGMVARTTAKDILSRYASSMRVGLMSFKLGQDVSQGYISASPYDVSYDPRNYDPNFSGDRGSSTKRFKREYSAGKFVYFNVNLPMYSSGPQGNMFCYRRDPFPTAPGYVAPFKNPKCVVNNALGGCPSYDCYTQKSGISDAPPPAGGYGGSKYTLTFHPTDSDVAQGITDFGTRMMQWDVGRTWQSTSSPGGGYLEVPIADSTPSQINLLSEKLACNVPGNQTPCTAVGIKNAGMTPSEGTLKTALTYFKSGLGGNDTATGRAASAPKSTDCGTKYVIFLTDGLPTHTPSGGTYSTPADALVATSKAAADLFAEGVKTYIIGFALPYGTDPSTLDKVASAGGTGTAYYATDAASLKAAMDSVFKSILSETAGSGGGTAANGAQLASNASIFQTQFNSKDWSGSLRKFSFTNTAGVTKINDVPDWAIGSAGILPAASTVVPIPAARSRQILTWRTDTVEARRTGIPFRWPVKPSSPSNSELTLSQMSAIKDSSILEYIRGDQSNEGNTSGKYRVRSSGLLGDIVNSSPVYVGAPSAGYVESLMPGYVDFYTAHANRAPMLYVGANDGMLHAFDATSGQERMAYVPTPVMKNLFFLSSQNYPHHYYVDATPTIADVEISGVWKSYLVGSLGAGGQGIYALDVTDPTQFSEKNASSLVKWEFTDDETINGDVDLGYTFGRPAIGKTHDGSWVAIFGNGYNNSEDDGHASTKGTAVLYIVDIATGKLLKKIDTGIGSATTPNGLSSPEAVDFNGDYVVDAVYAGDLVGNLWKFDLTDSTPSKWAVAYSGKPLFVAKDASDKVQPITAKPIISLHPMGKPGYMVYFGSGKFLGNTDTVITGAQTQTMYAVWDNNLSPITGRASLQEQKITGEFSESGYGWRTLTANTVDWATKRGAYLDLTYGNANKAERVVADGVYQNYMWTQPTLMPVQRNACSIGLDGWLMKVTSSVARSDNSVFDVNKDGSLDGKDFRTSNGNDGAGAAAVNGKKLGGAPGQPVSIAGQECVTDSTGKVTCEKSSSPEPLGRQSWIELRN